MNIYITESFKTQELLLCAKYRGVKLNLLTHKVIEDYALNFIKQVKVGKFWHQIF